MALAWLLASVAAAGLPPSVDGEPLPSLAPVLERVSPSVVSVYTERHERVPNQRIDPFFRRFFDMPSVPRERVSRALGSGVIVDAENGYVLTNHHVIAGADQIAIRLSDGRERKARLIGSDADSDVAVLQIDNGTGLQAIAIADSSELRVGDFVVALGNPFGLGQTVTSGIVSALGRSALRGLSYQNFIQTDASINPGNSGGALINLRGELVGINTAIFSPSGGNVGIGFAIPANIAVNVMQMLVRDGVVRRGRALVQLQDVNQQLVRALQLPVSRGALVTDVLADSAASKAGLQRGDLIVQAEGQTIRNALELRNLIGLVPAEQPIQLALWRGKERLEVQSALSRAPLLELAGASVDTRLRGARFVSTLADKAEGGKRELVTIAEVERNSDAWEIGLRRGDRVFAVNQQSVNDLDEFEQLIRASARSLLIGIERRGERYLIALR